MKVLVTAATKGDSTGQIARGIGRALQTRGFRATVSRPEDVRSLDSYDAVVVGSAVHNGHWLRTAQKLVRRSAAEFASRPVWMFSSGTSSASPDATEFAWITHARDHHVFNDELDDIATWVDAIAEQLRTRAA
jgi:menaquinone-dependent protoporphyrinogen oxidase